MGGVGHIDEMYLTGVCGIISGAFPASLARHPAKVAGGIDRLRSGHRQRVSYMRDLGFNTLVSEQKILDCSR